MLTSIFTKSWTYFRNLLTYLTSAKKKSVESSNSIVINLDNMYQPKYTFKGDSLAERTNFVVFGTLSIAPTETYNYFKQLGEVIPDDQKAIFVEQIKMLNLSVPQSNNALVIEADQVWRKFNLGQ